MEIIVCIKAVLDPDLPPAKFKVDERKNMVIPPEGMPSVINPYDALAVEAALQLKEKHGGKITVLTVGDTSSEVVLRKVLAMGADECLTLSDPSFPEADGFGVARVLAAAIAKIGAFDLILCGRQSSDWDIGMVGLALSEFLDIPVIARAKAITVLDGKVQVERALMNGLETYESEIPALISVSNEFGQARIPTGRGIIFAAKKPIPVWEGASLGIDPSVVGEKAVRNKMVSLYVPLFERKCEMITGESVAEAAAVLAEKIIAIK